MSKEKTINIQKPDIKEVLKDPQKYADKVSVSELVKMLKALSHYYYNTDDPVVSDEIFDTLRDTLEKRDHKNKFLREVGATISKDKVDLPYSMFSLDKIKPDTGVLDKWKSKYGGPYNISDKLDGVSALIYKTEDGKEVKMYTRGNGIQGQDISHLILYVVSKAVKFKDIPNGAAIRGELEISKSNFEKLGPDYKNARNTVAGLVNSKHFSMKLAKVTDFIAYSIINPRYTKIEQMKKLKEWHFPVAVNRTETFKTLTADMLGDYLEERRSKGLYDIDGIVVMDSSKAYSLSDSNPEYGFAFKKVLKDQVAETTVLEVVWTPSMYGYLKPKVRVKPLKLSGVTITWVTAFHAKFVKANNLGPGSVIKLVRSGDVIPHILEVLKPSTSGNPSMPEVAYTWDKTSTNIIIKDLHGDAKNTVVGKKVANFFKILGVKHISKGIVAKLVDSGYDSVIKILKADKDDLVEIDGIGDTMVKKIFDGIKEAFKTLTLAQLLAGSMVMGKGMGVRKNKLVVKAYPNIMKEKWDTEKLIEKLKEVEGFDTVTATMFARNFDSFKKFYKDLKEVADIKHLDNIDADKKAKKKDGNNNKADNKKARFEGQKIVFTGFRDKELEDTIEEEGGKISSAVSKNTTIVVYNDKDSSKYKKAIELNIATESKENFFKKYK